MLMNKKIELGNEVYLTDPCYDITTWCQQLLKNVKSGKWVVDYEYNEYEDGTQQEVILSVAHEDYGMTIFNDYDEVVDSVVLGVDSGTIGIFDKRYYENYHKGVWVNTSYGGRRLYSRNLYEKWRSLWHRNKLLRRY